MSEAPTRHDPGRRALLRRAPLAPGAALLALALLVLLPRPLDVFWIPSVAAIELGHVLALVSALVALVAWRASRPPTDDRRRDRLDRVAVAMPAVAAVIFLTPMLRALPVAAALPPRLEAAFGPCTPRGLPGARPRPSPLTLTGLLGAPAAPGVDVETLVYGAGRDLALDLYRRVDARGDAPLVVVIHGGAWRGGTRAQLPDINRYLAARGYVVAAPSYRLGPAHPFPAARNDLRDALRYLTHPDRAASLGIDPTRVALFGRSAGGNLALLVAYDEPPTPIRAVVAYYAPTDHVWSWEHPGSELVIDTHTILWQYLGGPPDARAEAYRDASPLHHVERASPPTLLVHGGGDQMVKHRQSERLVEALDAAGVANLLLSLPWARHGFDGTLTGPGGQLAVYAVERFLAATLD